MSLTLADCHVIFLFKFLRCDCPLGWLAKDDRVKQKAEARLTRSEKWSREPRVRCETIAKRSLSAIARERSAARLRHISSGSTKPRACTGRSTARLFFCRTSMLQNMQSRPVVVV